MKYREFKITPKLVSKEHKNKKENKKTKTIIHDKIIVKIEEGKLLDVEFEFTNTGTEMLIIKNVSASCGCTIPEKPEEPIAPGQSGKIKATFDSKGRAGLNQKAITVIANTKETVHTLIFDVEVNNPQYAK
jgi:hypothetical protein